MLILTRRIGESIIIDDHYVDFTVLGIKGNQVRLGCKAANSVKIHREEVYERIQLEGKKENAPKDNDDIGETR